MSNAVFSLAGWSFLPDFITKQLLSFPLTRGLLSRILLSRATKSHQSSQNVLYTRTFALVVLSYLFYTLLRSITNTAPNFYELWGVPPNVDDAGLKAAFRRFARVWHPDRMGNNSGEQDGGEVFVRMRAVYEALKNPTMRLAYDRFGPDILLCQTCKTPRDYIRQGLIQASTYHVVTGLILVLLGMVGKPNPLAFWRYILYFILLFAELALILSPSAPLVSSPIHSPLSLPSATLSSVTASFRDLLSSSILRTPLERVLSPPSSILATILRALLPARVPYQHVQFLHQLFLFLNVALARVIPVLFPSPPDQAVLERQAAKIAYQMAKSLDSQSQDVVQNVMQTIKPAVDETSPSKSTVLDKPTFDLFTGEMENIIVEGTLKGAGPEVWERAVKQGKGLNNFHNVDSFMETVRQEVQDTPVVE